jgi:hypothetical protein
VTDCPSAAADGHLHLLARGIELAVICLCDRNDVLRIRQPNAGVGFGDTACRREMEGRNAGIRIAVGEHDHVGDIILVRHRAFDRDGDRHGVAVLGDFRQVEPHATFSRSLAAGEFLDQIIGVVGGECRHADPGAERQCTDAKYQHAAASDSHGHSSHLGSLREATMLMRGRSSAPLTEYRARCPEGTRVTYSYLCNY